MSEPALLGPGRARRDPKAIARDAIALTRTGPPGVDVLLDGIVEVLRGDGIGVAPSSRLRAYCAAIEGALRERR